MTSSRFNRDENPEERKPSDFSIEHILTKAGENCAPKSLQQNKNLDKAETIAFPWLHCTRYCPPKIPSTYFFYQNDYNIFQLVKLEHI